MPVRLSSTAVLVWPDAGVVDGAVRRWATALTARVPEIVAVGYFGSYARGDWGVGSDVDLVVVMAESGEPFERRAGGARWDATGLPVPADVVVYTRAEWAGLVAPPRGVVWVVGGAPGRRVAEDAGR